MQQVNLQLWSKEDTGLNPYNMQTATESKVAIPSAQLGISVGRTQVCSVRPSFPRIVNQVATTGSAQYCYC